jgi:hypothetical protein
MESITEPNPYCQPQSSTSAKKCLFGNNSQSKPTDEALLKNVVPSASQKPTAFSLGERLRQLLADAKTVDLRSTPSPQDRSEHALRQMQIKYRTQGIMTIDLLSSVIRAAGTGACISSMESSDSQAAQLITRLSEAGLAHQMPSQGKLQGHFSQYIIPSAWNPLDQHALEGCWPLPLAKVCL